MTFLNKTDFIPAYARESTCFFRLLFKLPALLLWIMFFFASLSSMLKALLNRPEASAFAADLRIAFTTVRVDLCW